MEIKLLSSLTKEERILVKGLSIKKGLTIFKEGEACENLGIVVSGEVEILSYTTDGKPIIYNTLKAGGVFGNNLLFSSSNIYKGNVVANEQTTLALIKKEDVINLMQTNKEFLLEYLKITSDFGKDLNSKIQVVSLDNAEDRVMLYLSMNNNEVKFKSITKLAEYLSLTREALSRSITRLEKKHLVVREDHIIRKK